MSSGGDLAYTGPAHAPRAQVTNRVEEFNILSTYAYSTSAATETFNSDITSLNPTDFADFSAVFNEYRVLSTTVKYVPGVENGNPSFGGTPIWLPHEVYRFRGLTSTPSTSTARRAVDSLDLHPINQSWTKTVKAIGTGELDWYTSGNSPPAANLFGVQVVSPSTDGSGGPYQIATFLQSFLVEFRQRL